MPPFVSYAQHGEDVILWRALGSRHKVTYVDVGAFDPSEDSVTRALYERGWRGVNIEPQEDRLAAFLTARPEDINLAVAIGSEDGTTELIVPANPGWTTTQGSTSVVATDEDARRVQVPLRRLGTLLPELGIEHVDVLKIDVECAEASAVRGLLDGPVRPTVCVIEGVGPGCQRAEGDRAVALLVAAGYTHCMFDGLNHYLTTDPDLVEALSLPASPVDGYVHRSVPEFEAERSHLRATIAALSSENIVLRGEATAAARAAMAALVPNESAAADTPAEELSLAPVTEAPEPTHEIPTVTTVMHTEEPPDQVPFAPSLLDPDERSSRRRATFARLITSHLLHDPNSDVRGEAQSDGSHRVVDVAELPTATPPSIVRTLYLAILGREPDDEGMDAWVAHVATGATPYDVAVSFANSGEARSASDVQRRRAAEYLRRLEQVRVVEALGLGGLLSGDSYAPETAADAIFIDALYEVALQRRPTPAELKHEIGKLRSGVGRQWMIRALADRPEAKERLLGTTGGVRATLARMRARRTYARDFQALVVAAESRRLVDLLHVVRTTPEQGLR